MRRTLPVRRGEDRRPAWDRSDSAAATHKSAEGASCIERAIHSHRAAAVNTAQRCPDRRYEAPIPRHFSGGGRDGGRRSGLARRLVDHYRECAPPIRAMRGG